MRKALKFLSSFSQVSHNLLTTFSQPLLLQEKKLLLKKGTEALAALRLTPSEWLQLGIKNVNRKCDALTVVSDAHDGITLEGLLERVPSLRGAVHESVVQNIQTDARYRHFVALQGKEIARHTHIHCHTLSSYDQVDKILFNIQSRT